MDFIFLFGRICCARKGEVHSTNPILCIHHALLIASEAQQSGCPLLCGYVLPTLLSAACLPCGPAIASLSAVSQYMAATYRYHPLRKQNQSRNENGKHIPYMPCLTVYFLIIVVSTTHFESIFFPIIL